MFNHLNHLIKWSSFKLEVLAKIITHPITLIIPLIPLIQVIPFPSLIHIILIIPIPIPISIPIPIPIFAFPYIPMRHIISAKSFLPHFQTLFFYSFRSHCLVIRILKPIQQS